MKKAVLPLIFLLFISLVVAQSDICDKQNVKCLEKDPASVTLINDFRSLEYGQLATFSSDNDVSAKALYDQASGFKDIALLKRQYEGVVHSNKKVSQVLNAFSENVLSAHKDSSGNIRFDFFVSSADAATYVLNWNNQVVAQATENDLQGNSIVFLVSADELQKAGVTSLDISEFSKFSVSKGDEQGKVFARYGVSSVSVPSPLISAATVDRIPADSISIGYDPAKLALEISIAPNQVGSTAHLLIDDQDIQLNGGIGVDGKFKAKVDLSYPNQIKLKDALMKDSSLLFSAKIKTTDATFTPSEIYVTAPRLLESSGVIPVVIAPTPPTAPEKKVQAEQVGIIDLTNTEELKQQAITACAQEALGIELSKPNSKQVEVIQQRMTSVQPGASDTLVNLVRSATNDPSEQVTLAGIMSKESLAKVDIGDSSAGARGVMQFISLSAVEMKVPYKDSYGDRCANKAAAKVTGQCALCLPSGCNNGDARKQPDIEIASANVLLQQKKKSLQKCIKDSTQGKNIVVPPEDLFKFTIAAYNRGEGNICHDIERVISQGSQKDASKVTWEDVAALQLFPSQTRCYVPAVIFFMSAHRNLFNVETIGVSKETVSTQLGCADCGLDNQCSADDCRQRGCIVVSKIIGSSCADKPAEVVTPTPNQDPCNACGKEWTAFCNKKNCDEIKSLLESQGIGSCTYTPGVVDSIFGGSCSSAVTANPLVGGCTNVDRSKKIFPLRSVQVTSCYGKRILKGSEQWHPGIDFNAPIGTDVLAVDEGTVSKICVGSAKTDCGGYGYYVRIKHPDGSISQYNHLSQSSVSNGENVKQGQVIAKSGNTGDVTGPHLHFNIYCSEQDLNAGQDYKLDPFYYLPDIPLAKINQNACRLSPIFNQIYAVNPQSPQVLAAQPLANEPSDDAHPADLNVEIHPQEVYLVWSEGEFEPPTLVPQLTSKPVVGTRYLADASDGFYVEQVSKDGISLSLFSTDEQGVVNQVQPLAFANLVKASLNGAEYDFVPVEENKLYVQPEVKHVFVASTIEPGFPVRVVDLTQNSKITGAVITEHSEKDIPEVFVFKHGESREVNAINYVVLHHTGTFSAQDTMKVLSKRGLSVHYVLDKDGALYRLVPEEEIAWHAAGRNADSIGIEIVNTGNAEDKYTQEQYRVISVLLDYWAKTYPNFKKDNEHVLAHYEVSSQKWDPSPNFDWSQIGLEGHALASSDQVPKGAGYA